MKILHTADLHIGKRLEGKTRLDEQTAVLGEICDIARREKVDAVVVAGDIFDVSTPHADAKRAFYRFALACAESAPFIAIAGNHDSPEDFTAPRELAEAADIKLIGAGEFVSYDISGERLNIAAVPYPDDSRIKSAAGGEETFAERIEKHIKGFTGNFVRGENNVLLSHLYMTGAAEAGDENALGPARMLPKSLLPDGCYIALGHIHKPMTVSKTKNAYYSGSPLNYHFDSAADNDKSVIVADMTAGVVKDVKRIPLTSGIPLVTVSVTDFDGAMRALDENPDALVKIKYESALPLAAGEAKKLRAKPNFVKIEVTITRQGSAAKHSMKAKTDAELFDLYYKQMTGEEAGDDIKDMFAEIIGQAGGRR